MRHEVRTVCIGGGRWTVVEEVGSERPSVARRIDRAMGRMKAAVAETWGQR